MTFKPVDYVKYNGYQRSDAFKCLVENYDLITALPYPVHSLDIGCGAGDVTKLLTYFNNIVSITAFDKAIEMVVYADTFNSDPRIRYAVADVEDRSTWPEPIESQYDLVTSFCTLHWIKNTSKTMENIFASLKPGGLFFARLLGRRSQHEIDLFNFVKSSAKWSKYIPNNFVVPKPWMTDSDPAKFYSQYLTDVGFEDVLCTNVPVVRRIESKNHSKAYLKMSRLNKCSIPEKDFEQFADECNEAWLKSGQLSEQGSYEMRTFLIDVKAKKT